MAFLILRRAGLGMLTLALLSVVIFAGGQILPGDVGRSILGPLADARAVAALNHQLGADQPAVTLYWQWAAHAARGDFGLSTAFRAPVAPFVAGALARSVLLAAMTLAIVVPAAMAAGVAAALTEGRWPDRVIFYGGLAFTVLPEFVSGIILILVFGIWLRWLPIEAATAPGTGLVERLRHLILPALPLVLVLFGYIARIVRAGTVAALDADFTRTAMLKGLTRRTVMIRHVLRNALLPTIAVVAGQVSYLMGGLVVVETLFRYQGIGSLILTAARGKDYPMLQASILAVGAVFILANLAADIVTGIIDPRLRPGERK
jgi:peptide/nickel transport system permease protein